MLILAARNGQSCEPSMSHDLLILKLLAQSGGPITLPISERLSLEPLRALSDSLRKVLGFGKLHGSVPSTSSYILHQRLCWARAFSITQGLR